MRARVARCGTPSGYERHRRLGEQQCAACQSALAEYNRRNRAANGNTRKSRLHARAQGRAYRDLAHRYPDEYAALYAAHKAELFADDEQEAAS